MSLPDIQTELTKFMQHVADWGEEYWLYSVIGMSMIILFIIWVIIR